MEKTPFFKKTWFIILLFWLVPPIGIALMWTCRRKWKKSIKIALSVIFGIWFVLWCALLLSPSDDSADDDTPTAEEVTTACNEKYNESSQAHTSQITNETESEKHEEATSFKPVTAEEETATTKPTTTKPTTTKPTTTKAPTTVDPDSRVTVYKTETGKRYHYENPCGNGTYSPITLAEAKALGLTACEKCVLH